jgi:hypothetical protein
MPDRGRSRGSSSIQPTRTSCRMNESCAPTHATRSAAFMLQNTRPKRIQGSILHPTNSNILQDEYESCAPTHATRSAAFMLQERPTEADPGIRPRSNQLEHSAG